MIGKYLYLVISFILIAQIGFLFLNPLQADSAEMDNLVNRRISAYLKSNHVNGSVAIVKDQALIYNEGIGFANRKERTNNQPGTKFPIGSITKAIVATSIMQLQDQGKLSIYDSVSAYISDFPKGIKLIHLLNHTSGIQASKSVNQKIEPAEIVKKVTTTFPAGSKWDYNDINYLILGYIVEKVSGTPLHTYIQKNIFDKAMMRDAGFITKPDLRPNQAKGYVRVANQFIATKWPSSALLFGCGDIYATAYDISLFDDALMSGKLVSKHSLKQMLTPSTKSPYGLGLYHTDHTIYSRGVLKGWETLHVFYQQNQTNIVILLNVHDKRVNIHQLAAHLYKMIDQQAL